MKKKLVSILLCLCMVLTLLPTAALAEETTHTDHPVCGASCSHSDTTHRVTWQAWSTANALPTEAGNYYLTADVTLSATWEPVNGTVLCLNGHTITGKDGAAVITVKNEVTFTLTDCNTTDPGKITHATNETGCGVELENENSTNTAKEKPVFNMYGGSITGNTATYGGGVYMTAATIFNLYGGTITDNTATSYGGGLYALNSDFTMYGGAITGNTAAYGGGLYMTGATCIMSGGTIGGTNTGDGNTAKQGGGLYMNGGEFTMSGTASITGNTAKDDTNGGKGGGVYVTNSSSTFTMSRAAGSSAAPSITGNKAAATNNDAAEVSSCGGGVYLDNAKFNLNAGTISGNEATVTGNGISKGGGVYMTGGYLACLFTMEGGTIGGTDNAANSAKYGGGVYVHGGHFTMEGGSITGNETKQSGDGGGVYLDNNNDIIFDMKGGTISNNTAKNNGGGVYLCSGSFTMSKDEDSNEAPSITGNNVTNGSGGGVYMTGGTFTVSGPVSITTNTVGSGTDASNVYLNTNKVITITGALNSGDDNASIGVTLASDHNNNGVFTSGWNTYMASVQDDNLTDYFTSDDSNLNVKKDTSGELKLQGHEHTWTYALQSGTTNTIIATCNGTGTCGLTDGKGGTYTIKAPSSLIYSGGDKKATVTSSPVSGVTLPTAPTITYTKSGESNFTGKPKDAGTYTASITLGDATAYVTYTITKATPDAEDFSFTAPSNLTYDGSAKSATVTSDKTGMGEITVNYYKEDGTPLDDAPTDVGTYTVKISVAEGDNYTSASELTADSWTFTITKAAQTITVPMEQKTIQANSDADISGWASVAGVTGGSDPGALTYALDGTIPNGVTLENNTLSVLYSVAADTAITINVTAAATGNYNEATGTFTVKVSPLPAASVATAPAANTLTYNGEEQALVVAGSTTDGTMVYRLGSDGNYSESIPEAKDAATYTVYYKVQGDDYHSDSGDYPYVTVTIAPKTLTKTDLEYTGDSITKEYDGNTNCTLTAVSVKSGVLCGDDTLTINGTAVYNSADVATASSVTFTPNVIATGNYRLAAAETLTISASITAKSITPTVDDIGNVDFTGNPLTPDVTVKNGDTPLTLNTDYTVSYTDNTDAGTATVNVSAKQDGNYTFTTVTKNFTITTAGAQTLSDITVNQKYSVTTEQTVSIGRGGMPDNAGALTYAKKSDSAITGISSWSVNETTGAVSYTLSGSGAVGDTITLPVKISSTNYADSTVNVKITLTAKDGQNVLTLTASADTVVYNGTLTLSTTGGSGEGAVSYSVTNGTGAASISGSTLTATKVGTVTVKATKAADDNYAAAESNTITITINKATPTGEPKYTAITTSGKKLSDAGLTTTDSTFSVDGSVKWVNDAGVELPSDTAVAANTSYKWLFTPSNENYTTLTGNITLYSVSAPSYSGGGSSGGSSSASGTVTVPVSSDSGTVNVRAEVSKNGTATVEISDRQIEAVAKNGSGTVTIDVSGAKNAESVQVPAQVVETTNKAENTGLTVALPDGSVALDSTALESASQGKDITISVQQVPATDLNEQQQKAVGDMANIGLVVDVDLFVGGTKQSSFNGGTLTISIPYTPKRGEDTSKLTVWFIRDDGTIENKGGYYDAAKGCFIFETDHLSRYVLVNVSARFADVPVDAYFAGAVNWAVQNGVTGGVTETAFAPYASCTRAQIVTFLYRYAVSAGLDVSVGEDTNILSYNDALEIPEYAIPAFQWACGAGITQGNNGNLMPNQTCTRAQAVAFLYRFAALAGLDVSVGEDTNILSYSDMFTVPEYAIPAFQWACGAGVMQGNDGNLMPNQTCTRAQIVTMLYRLLGE